MAAATRQQHACGLGQSRGGSQSAQGQDTVYDSPPIGIDGYQTFCMQFAEGNVQCPLVRPELSQTVQREIDTFADADSSGASKQKCVGRQVIGTAQLVAEQLIVQWRQWSRQILRPRWEVLATDQVRLEAVAIGSQIVQQTAETQQVVGAGLIA